jgi:hypothetical protein
MIKLSLFINLNFLNKWLFNIVLKLKPYFHYLYFILVKYFTLNF